MFTAPKSIGKGYVLTGIKERYLSKPEVKTCAEVKAVLNLDNSVVMKTTCLSVNSKFSPNTTNPNEHMHHHILMIYKKNYGTPV